MTPLYCPGRVTVLTPDGVGAISRWLSAAIPPGAATAGHVSSTPVGVAARSTKALRPLPGSINARLLAGSGGIAALNHRLIAATPAGVKTAGLSSFCRAPLRVAAKQSSCHQLPALRRLAGAAQRRRLQQPLRRR